MYHRFIRKTVLRHLLLRNKTNFFQIYGAVGTSVALDEVRDRDRRTYYNIINTMKLN